MHFPRLFAVYPVHDRRPQLKPRQLVAPKPLAKADHARAARQLFLISFNLHAATLPSPVGQMLSNRNYFSNDTSLNFPNRIA
jgi:hypothetical protein